MTVSYSNPLHKRSRDSALGTLAELEVLGAIYGGPMFDREHAKDTVAQYCTSLCEAVGYDAFPAFSTRRQFQRYLEYWDSAKWHDLAQAALTALGDGASWVGQLYSGVNTMAKS